MPRWLGLDRTAFFGRVVRVVRGSEVVPLVRKDPDKAVAICDPSLRNAKPESLAKRDDVLEPFRDPCFHGPGGDRVDAEFGIHGESPTNLLGVASFRSTRRGDGWAAEAVSRLAPSPRFLREPVAEKRVSASWCDTGVTWSARVRRKPAPVHK